MFRTVRLLSYEASEWVDVTTENAATSDVYSSKMDSYWQYSEQESHDGLGMIYETVFLTPSIAGYFFYMVRRISQPADMQKRPAI